MIPYHEATKHTVERLRASPHTLDWANMPDPFRHYEGVPVVDLPADPPPLETPALEILRGVAPPAPALDGPVFLSRLLYYSASISASKRVPSTGYRYALRVNPSSGNLHPTGFHFAARGLRGWEDGLYHYRVPSHMAELRMRGAVEGLGDAPLVFALTSIAWREAWKYRARAYRYCLHDIGHAWQALALAARACGCAARARGHFDDAGVSRILGVADEWPMLLIEISGGGLPFEDRRAPPREWFGGAPNRLSEEQIEYPLIRDIHAATCTDGRLPAGAAGENAPGEPGEFPLRPEAAGSAPFGAVARRRRSALDFEGGPRTISFEQLSTMLDAAYRPLEADFPARLVRLYLFVHRVEKLPPGVYRHTPEPPSLDLRKGGDQRLIAAGLCLGQDLAANSCVTFAMIGRFERARELYGERGYRYLHFEAGAIGQRFYLAAEAMGFQSTGIGAFYDDHVHRYLDLDAEDGQVIYCFASGYAVPDPRLEG